MFDIVGDSMDRLLHIVLYSRGTQNRSLERLCTIHGRVQVGGILPYVGRYKSRELHFLIILFSIIELM